MQQKLIHAQSKPTNQRSRERERERENRGGGNFQGQTNRSDGGFKAKRRETVKANKRKSMEEKRRAERVEFYFTGQLEAKIQGKKHRCRNVELMAGPVPCSDGEHLLESLWALIPPSDLPSPAHIIA